ncbi:glycosyltransferase [Lactobacillus corticis]|uniref:Glycosyl transferase n=1 Tax=Lactobacillus corticis TaxID=2201249 RepID=A0A916QFQ0_9LACO|nr:glycosyltransferase [Lactobacillus corticis]GFZ26169.1 glycosyl transferase [Lactobacillus corticis]
MKRIKVAQIGAENFGYGGRSVIAYGLTKYMPHEIENDFISYSKFEKTSVTTDIEKRGRIVYLGGDMDKNTIEYFKNNNYSIVHIHADNSYEAIKSIIRIKRAGSKAKLIVHGHVAGPVNFSILKKAAICLLRPVVNLLADKKIAVSADAAAYMFGKASVKSVSIINDGIDLEKYQYDEKIRLNKRKELQLKHKFVIGDVARLVDQKNQTLLIEAFSDFQKIDSDSVLILVGSGPYEGNLRDRVRSLGLEDKVMFLGNRDDVPELLQAFDCFAFPSKFEGFGISALESQVAGLPTAISNKIPKKVNQTKLVRVFPIEDSNVAKAKWSQYFADVKNASNFDREQASIEASDLIRNAGYDLKASSKRLEEIYHALMEKGK